MEKQPVACTLQADDLRERLAWIATLTREALHGFVRTDVTLTLRYDPGSVRRVREMVRQEQACCAFLMFEMHELPDEVRLTIKAPEEARATADALFQPFLPSHAQTHS
jgi:hypothetical protein